MESYQGAAAHGWIVSVVGHAVVIAGLIMTDSVRSITVPQESFQWNVQVVTSATHDSPAAETPTAHAEPSTFKAAPAARSMTGSSRAAVQRVVQPVERKPSIAQRMAETSTVRPDQSRPESVSREETVVSAVDRSRLEHSPEPVDEQLEDRPSESVRREPSIRERPLASVMESSTPIVRVASIQAPAVVTRQVAAVTTVTGPLETEVSSGPSEAVLPAAVLAHPASSAESEASGSAAPSGLPSTEQGDMRTSFVHRDRSQTPKTEAREESGPIARVPSAGESKRSDYGWLASALRTRIEEIKSYSAEARTHEWEGRVVVAASVKADGTLVNIRVVESSGNGYLDEDARQMVRYASPMTLSQPLGSAQVTVKVPIVFELQ